MYKTLVDVQTLADLLGIDRDQGAAVETDDAIPSAPATVVLDCRFSLADTAMGERAWREAHIPGAFYAHLDRDLSSPIVPGETGRHPLPERESLAEKLRAWGISRDTQVIAVDAGNGAVAARAWWLLRWLGHESVAVLDGGYAQWEAAGLPLSDAPPSTLFEGSFTPGEPLEKAISIEQVDSGSFTLIDARESARYRGEDEPIDPVAGHIPGAINRPFADNVDAQGRFLAPPALQARFAKPALEEQLRGDVRLKPLAHYCGSGVTAAHNILAMRQAGLEPGALYAGSFSEWVTRDGGRRAVSPRDDA